jgi:iron complex transport system ATP-binding protein
MYELNDCNIALPNSNKLVIPNCSLNATETWGILGANGVGKTTLLHTLAGLYSHYSGNINLNSKTLSSYSPKQRARQIGVLLQDSLFEFPMPVLDAILLGAKAHNAGWQTITTEQLTFAEKLFTLFDLVKLKTRCITKLSGGERRRVSLAILAMQQPNIYLLDEPSNHLDIKHQKKAMNYFCQLKRLTVMTLHDINLANQYCSHIILIFPDNIMLGTCAELMTTENLTQLYQTPFKYYSECNMFSA